MEIVGLSLPLDQHGRSGHPDSINMNASARTIWHSPVRVDLRHIARAFNGLPLRKVLAMAQYWSL
jgi:hypothetical protein